MIMLASKRCIELKFGIHVIGDCPTTGIDFGECGTKSFLLEQQKFFLYYEPKTKIIKNMQSLNNMHIIHNRHLCCRDFG